MWIVKVELRGQSLEAFTTNTIQQSLGSGTAVVNGRKDTGVALERGNFTVTNPDLNEVGGTYHWIAVGD